MYQWGWPDYHLLGSGGSGVIDGNYSNPWLEDWGELGALIGTSKDTHLSALLNTKATLISSIFTHN